MMDPILRGSQIRFRHSDETFDFAFPTGQKTALIGPNGSGKTSLSRACLGEPGVLQTGTIYFANHSTPIHRLSPRKRINHMALVPQEPSYPNEMTVENFLRLSFIPTVGFLSPLSEVPSSVHDDFNLEPLKHKILQSLSSGERQRVFLARAFLQSPQLLVLDEPTNHLDPGQTALFWEQLLRIHASRPLSSLTITHDTKFIERHADWVCALREGRLVFNGPKQDFLDQVGLKNLYQLC